MKNDASKNSKWIYIILISLITFITLGYFIAMNNKEVNEPKIYSLVEGKINGNNTYFLISVDSIEADSKPFIITINNKILDSMNLLKKCYGCKVSINNLPLKYDKEVEDIQPIVDEIKSSTGYEISGIISNKKIQIDSLP